MYLGEAIIALRAGYKVKLPEWTGYWFMPTTPDDHELSDEDRIHVFTKTGDVLNTPWIDKYRDRKDYEVTDGKMGFDFAVLALKSGKLVTREGWGGKAIYVGTHIPKPDSKMNRRYMFITVMPNNSIQFGDDHNHEVNRMPYTPNQTDMFAEDWKIYERPHAE